MSGPSSSDLITRRKFLITERSDPLPCCFPRDVVQFVTSDVSGTISDISFNIVPFAPYPPPTQLTITTLNPIYVVGIANFTDASLPTSVALKITYSLNPSPAEYDIFPAVSKTLSTAGSATVAGSGSFTPPSVGTYNFYLKLKQTSGGGAYYTNAFMYIQGS